VKAQVSLQYEATNSEAEAVGLTLAQTEASVDVDDNALPDDLFNDVAPGELWVSTQNKDGRARTILVANLDDTGLGGKAAGTYSVQLGSDIKVTAPNTDALVGEGLVDSGESTLLLVEVVGDLAALLDRIDGVDSPVDRQAWADAVNGIAPAAALASYVQISLLYTYNSGLNYNELKDLTGTSLSVGLALSGLDLAGTNAVQLWSYPTMVDDLEGVVYLANDPDAQGWRLIDPNAVAVDVGAGTLDASLQTLSVFTPFDSGLAISSIAPSRIPSNFAGADVTLTGVFPTETGLDLAGAAAAYSVTIAGAAADFRLGPAKQARARREVVLSSGSIGSVQILERSGIGDGRRLRELGIDVHADRPGVGENLQDHLQLRTIYKVKGVSTLNQTAGSIWGRAWMGLQYFGAKRGPMTMSPSQLGAFAYSSADVETPDLEYHVQPLSLDKFGDPLHRFPAFTASVCHLRPESRGSVHIQSADVCEAPRIAPNYLSTESDRLVAARAIRLTRRIAGGAALARYSPSEYLPGPDFQTDDQLAEAAARIGTTIFHPVGTCRMGAETDSRAVVDGRLRVIGVEGLRVADASVMPTITSGNTNSPTLMIAERAAEWILAGE